jgi:hypothetical protein
VIRQDGKAYLENTFVPSMFKNLGMRDTADVKIDEFLLERSVMFLEYDMVTHFHPWTIYSSIKFIAALMVNNVKLLL